MHIGKERIMEARKKGDSIFRENLKKTKENTKENKRISADVIFINKPFQFQTPPRKMNEETFVLSIQSRVPGSLITRTEIYIAFTYRRRF